MTKMDKKNVSAKNGNSETETNKLNIFNFDTSISEKALGNNELFIFADKTKMADSNGWYFRLGNQNASIIEINKDVNNFDEFITILFHELGHHVLHEDDNRLMFKNYMDNSINVEEIEEQANLFAEYMRHIFYNTINLVRLSKSI